MLQQQNASEPATASDKVDELLRTVLRGLDIECKRQSSGVHLLSADKAQVESLLVALDHLLATQQAIRRQLQGEPGSATAANLLRDLVANTASLRGRFWPEYYHSCEALTRVMDILELAQRSLARLY